MLFAITISAGTWCLADQLNFSARYGIGIWNYGPVTEQFAKTYNGSSSYEFELSYYRGDMNGLLVGIVTGSKQAEYIQERNSTRIWDKFLSEYRYSGIRLGYWFPGVKEDSIASVGMTYGKGNFDFESTDHVSGVQNQKVDLLEFDMNVQVPFYHYNEFSLDWIGAVRISNIFLSGFDYKNVRYNASEISTLQPYVLLGLAVSY